MRVRKLSVIAAAVTLLSLAQGADSAPSPAGSEVVLRAGSTTVDAQQIAAAFSRLRPVQRERYGALPTAQLRGYVDQVVTREALLTEQGRMSGLASSDRVRAQQRLLLGDALVARMRAKLEREAPITDAEVSAYYESHPELFRTPERIRIFRLLVEDEVEARKLIAQARTLTSIYDWQNWAREKSKDRATAERGGDLGFVAADGTTDVPELEVDPALFAAASKVKDGAVVEEPVLEGKRFAVVWRRGSVAARSVPLAAEAPRIRQQLIEDRLGAELQETIATLRQAHLRDHFPVRLNGREFPLRE